MRAGSDNAYGGLSFIKTSYFLVIITGTVECMLHFWRRADALEKGKAGNLAWGV